MGISKNKLEWMVLSIVGAKKEKVSSQELMRLLKTGQEEVNIAAASLCDQGFLVRTEEPTPEYPQDPMYNTVYYKFSLNGEKTYQFMGKIAERTNLFTSVTSP